MYNIKTLENAVTAAIELAERMHVRQLIRLSGYLSYRKICEGFRKGLPQNYR